MPKLLLLLSFVALCVAASAQAPPPVQGPPPFQITDTFSSIPVLKQPGVMDELKLSKGQKVAVKKVLPAPGPLKPGQLEKAEAVVVRVLNAAQRTRLSQLSLQFHSPSVVLRSDVAKAIRLTATQRVLIGRRREDILIKALRQVKGDPNQPLKLTQAQSKAIRDKTAKAIYALLTRQQKATLDFLGGKKFNFKR